MTRPIDHSKTVHPLLRMDLPGFDRLPSIHSRVKAHYVGTIASIVGALAAAASTSASIYASMNQPTAPNLASSSRRVARAQAAALPYQRGLAAAEAQGGSALRFGYTQATYTPEQRQALSDRLSNLQGRLDSLQAQDQQQSAASTGVGAQGGTGAGRQSGEGHGYASGAAGGRPGLSDSARQQAQLQKQIADLQGQLTNIPENGGTVYLNKQGKPVAQNEAMADFSGYGQADIEGELARQMADVQERLGAKYGTQFAEESRREAEQADPMGFAARDKELALIQKGIDNPMPINPMASTLDQRMKARVDAGSGLDDMSRDVLDAAIARSNADRGGNTSAGDVEHNMSTGMEGAARRQAGIGQAQNWLSSGATPEDVEYRREQQNLSNLGSFMQGQTPQSQFANLSGAGQGATPFYPGQQGPQMPGGAAAAGSGYGVAGYLASLRNAQGQANPWMAGLSSILSGMGSFANSGAGAGAQSPYQGFHP